MAEIAASASEYAPPEGGLEGKTERSKRRTPADGVTQGDGGGVRKGGKEVGRGGFVRLRW